MVAQAARSNSNFSGIRPLSISHDLISVANLIEQAFAADMDDTGRAAVRDMRLAGRVGFMFGWMEVFEPQGEGLMPGFVWIENNQVVGNATVRRLSIFSRGWMIGNVAVKPEWRGRGIARALMTSCIDLARSRSAEWVSLQVRSDNPIARGLYDSLGFRSIGETVELVRTEPDWPAPPARSNVGQLRLAQPHDTNEVFKLAQAAYPDNMRLIEPHYRSQFEVGWDQRLIDFLSGESVKFYVIEHEQAIVGAAWLKVKRRSHNGKLGVWAAPAYRGQVEHTLLDAVLSQAPASTRSITARISSDHPEGYDALLRRQFTVIRNLLSMRLDLNTA